MAKHNEIGAIGERLACEYLSKNGYKIIDRNYQKKWGELDIIAENNEGLHFVEVKCVSREMPTGVDFYEPEENVHQKKRRRLKKIIETYLYEMKIDETKDYYIDVVTIFYNADSKKTAIRFIKDIVL